jgi:hypothetical protein
MKARSGTRPHLTREQYQRILEVKAMRARTPSNKELAREFGVSAAVINHATYVGLRNHEQGRE